MPFTRRVSLRSRLRTSFEIIDLFIPPQSPSLRVGHAVSDEVFNIRPAPADRQLWTFAPRSYS